MKMEQTVCSETSGYKLQTPGELPRRKHTAFRTRRKFEIKDVAVLIQHRVAGGSPDRGHVYLLVYALQIRS